MGAWNSQGNQRALLKLAKQKPEFSSHTLKFKYLETTIIDIHLLPHLFTKLEKQVFISLECLICGKETTDI